MQFGQLQEDNLNDYHDPPLPQTPSQDDRGDAGPSNADPGSIEDVESQYRRQNNDMQNQRDLPDGGDELCTNLPDLYRVEDIENCLMLIFPHH